MYEYRGEFIEETTAAELAEKWDRFQEVMREAMIADQGDRFEDWDLEAWLQDVTHGEFDFGAFVSGNPNALDTVLDNLDQAYESINASWTDFAALSGELDEWDTRTAEDFRVRYMGKFPEANLSQLEVIEELIVLTGAYRELIYRVRYDAAAILDSAIVACENFEPSDGSSSWNSFFTTASVLAGVAGAVALALPAGAAAAVGAAATITGAASGVGGSLTNEGEQASRTYSEAAQIYVDVMSTLQNLREQAAAEADAIQAAIESDVPAVGDGKDLVIDRAHVANLSEGELMEQFPYRGDTADISVSLYQLWRAGKLRLPLVAVSYADAARKLNNTRAPRTGVVTGVSYISGAAAQQWSDLFNVLQGRLAEVRNDLVATGEILCDIADAYARADMDGADLIHESANSLLEDLWLQIDESTDNGNLDEIPPYVPQAPEPDSPLGSVYSPGGYY